MTEFYLYLIDGEPVTIHKYDEPLPTDSLAYWTHQMNDLNIIIHLYKTGRDLDEETMRHLTEAAVQYIQRQLASSA